MTVPPTIAHAVQQTQEWLKELRDNGGLATEAEAYSVLRAVLHQLRDRLTLGEAVDLGALEVRIFAETAPSDGPIGDSALLLSDGTGRVLDQNDCRPSHPEEIAALGPLDVHFLQYSGAM